MKKGQITIFIIVGIIVVAAIFLALYLRGQVGTDVSQSQLAARAGLSQDVAEVWDDIYNCVQSTSEEAVLLVAEQGGYMLPPKNSLSVQDSLIAYGYKGGKDVVPSLSVVKEEVSDYVEIFLPLCVDFSLFPKFKVTETEPKVKSVTITDDKVSVSVDYKVQLVKGTETTTLSEPFPVTIKTKLKKMIEAEKAIVEDVSKDSTQISFNTLGKVNFNTNIIVYDANTTVFAMTDNSSKVGGYDLTYIFAIEVK